MNAAAEQREYPRLAAECAATVRSPGAGAQHAATIWNISAGGMLLSTAAAVEVGATLELQVAAGHCSIPAMHAVVRVVRRAADRRGHTVGVRILSVS